MPGTVLGTGDTASIDGEDKVPAVYWGDRESMGKEQTR